MRRLASLLIGLVMALTGPAKTVTTVVPAQTYEQRRAGVFALMATDESAAEAKLQELIKERPDDSEALFSLGTLISRRAHAMKPGAKRQKALKEARECMVQARSAGSTEPFIDTFLAGIKADGSEEAQGRFSEDDQLDKAIRAAEQAYSRRDYPQAVTFYQQALRIDPQHYMATLYLGDAYFAGGQSVAAITWYTKAAELNPNRETAFRYCGDALMRLGKKTWPWNNTSGPSSPSRTTTTLGAASSIAVRPHY